MRIHRHPRAVSCAVILPTVKGRHVDYCHCAAAATPSCRRSLPLSLSRSPFSFSLAAKCRQGLAFICMAIAGALWFYRFLVLFHIHAGVSCPAPLLPSLPLWLLFVVLLLLFALLCSPCPGCTSFCKLFRRHQHFAAGIWCRMMPGERERESFKPSWQIHSINYLYTD